MIQKIIAFVLAVLALIGVFLFFDTQEPGIITETGSVIDVIDGDTLLVDLGTSTERVRLLGIDAPELDFTDNIRNTKKECFALESQEKLKQLVINKTIILENDNKNELTDQYGRLLRYIYLPGDVLVNELMLSSGSARLLSFFPISKIKTLRNAEQKAKEDNAGLWEVCPH